MRYLSTTRQRLGASAVALAVAAGGGAVALSSGATASASTPESATTTTAATTTHHARSRHHGLLARADYASLQVKRHGHWVTVVLDRGKVTAVSPYRITIARPDGTTVEITLSSATKYRGVHGESGIQVGQHASVVSIHGSAVRVSQMHHR